MRNAVGKDLISKQDAIEIFSWLHGPESSKMQLIGSLWMIWSIMYLNSSSIYYKLVLVLKHVRKIRLVRLNHFCSLHYSSCIADLSACCLPHELLQLSRSRVSQRGHYRMYLYARDHFFYYRRISPISSYVWLENTGQSSPVPISYLVIIVYWLFQRRGHKCLKTR